MTDDALQTLWSEPDHWNRDGSYKCVADPRLLVPKRHGGGWTMNMEHPKAQVTLWGFLVLVIGSLVARGLFVWYGSGA